MWREAVSSYEGSYVRFREVRSYPKPFRGRRLPVVLGGNSDAALDRVAAYGDGWYGFNLAKVDLPERLDYLSARCEQSGRDRASLEIAVSLQDGRPEDAAGLAAMGVTELVIVEPPPADPGDSHGWVTTLADRWVVTDEPSRRYRRAERMRVPAARPIRSVAKFLIHEAPGQAALRPWWVPPIQVKVVCRGARGAGPSK